MKGVGIETLVGVRVCGFRTEWDVYYDEFGMRKGRRLSEASRVLDKGLSTRNTI